MFANPDGSFTSEEFTEPVRTIENGVWSNIDTDLVPVDGGLAPKHAIGGLLLSDGGDTTFASMDLEDRDVQWKWPDVLPAPRVEGNVATYPDVVDNGDLVVTALPTDFRHDIVLRAAPSDPVSFDIPVITGGPKVIEERAGSLAISTSAGDELLTAPQPVMYDARTDEFGDPTLLPVETDIASTKTGSTVALTPDHDFLSDPDTQYPVTVDPTWSAAPSGDTYVTTTNPGTNFGDADELRVGTPNAGENIARSFVRFNTAVAPWNDAQVSSATLTMNNFASSTCSGGTVRVYRLTEQFYATGASCTWS